MKKLVSIVLAVAMVFALAACGAKASPAATTDPTAAPAAPAVEATPEPVPEKEFYLKFNSAAAANETKCVGTQMFLDEVAELTNGTVTGELFPSATLFSAKETLPAIIDGNLEMCATEASYLLDYMPEQMNMLGACYIYRDFDHWLSVWSDPAITEPLFDEIAQKCNFRVLGTYYSGARCISLVDDKEVTCRGDLEGVQLRVANSQGWIDMGKALGADPVPMALSETYLALSTGAVNGQDNPLPATMKNGFGEVCKSITMTGHILATNWFGVAESVWQQMSDSQKEAMKTAAENACTWMNEQYLAEEESLISEFEKINVKVYRPDTKTIQSEVMDYYKNEVGTDSWDMDLYNKIQAK